MTQKLLTLNDFEGQYALPWLSGTSYLRAEMVRDMAKVAVNH